MSTNAQVSVPTTSQTTGSNNSSVTRSGLRPWLLWHRDDTKFMFVILFSLSVLVILWLTYAAVYHTQMPMLF